MIWRVLFPLFLVFAVVDGFISNLLFPQLLPLVYKDIFLIVVYFFFAINEKAGELIADLKRSFGNAVWFSWIGFVIIGFFQIFNPSSPGLLVGILGFKVIYFYCPLCLLAYAWVRQTQDVIRILKIIAYFSIPVNVFGMYQFFAGPEFLVRNFGPGFSPAIFKGAIDSTGGGEAENFFRIIGTFASTGQYSSFLDANAIFCLVLFIASRRSSEKILSMSCMILNFFTLLGTGSRAWFSYLIIQLAVFIFVSRRSRPALVAIFIAGLTFFVGFSWLGAGVAKRYKSLAQANMVRSRTYQTTFGMFTKSLNRYPLGRGLGSGSTAARHLGNMQPLFKQEFIENYPTKLQVETGIGGVALFYLLCFFLLARLRRWLIYFTFGEEEFGEAMIAFCMVQFALVSVLGLLDTPPTPIFLWFTLGLVAKLSKLNEESGPMEYPSETELGRAA